MSARFAPWCWSCPRARSNPRQSWTVHDRYRYLWMLKSGHFLLRDRNNLLEGDATLKLKPYLDFPGPVLGVDLDPDQHFLVTNSRRAGCWAEIGCGGQLQRGFQPRSFQLVDRFGQRHNRR